MRPVNVRATEPRANTYPSGGPIGSMTTSRRLVREGIPRAMVLSLFLPGLGQVSERRYAAAAFFFGLTALLAAIGTLTPYTAVSVALALPVWWMNVYDAKEYWFWPGVLTP